MSTSQGRLPRPQDVGVLSFSQLQNGSVSGHVVERACDWLGAALLVIAETLSLLFLPETTLLLHLVS